LGVSVSRRPLELNRASSIAPVSSREDQPRSCRRRRTASPSGRTSFSPSSPATGLRRRANGFSSRAGQC